VAEEEAPKRKRTGVKAMEEDDTTTSTEEEEPSEEPKPSEEEEPVQTPDIADLDDAELPDETLAPIQPDSGVILGDTDNVPEELQGHPALVINVKNPDPWADEDEEAVFTVRTRDEHNSILNLERDDFAEVIPGGVGNRAFGP
jgi:hypothetical protein